MNTILILLLVQLIITNCQDVKTIILNGLVATGKEGIEPFLGHILIGKNGKIIKVVRETGSDENDLKQKYDNVEFIDAKDKIVIPGGVDTLIFWKVFIILKVVIIFLQVQWQQSVEEQQQ